MDRGKFMITAGAVAGAAMLPRSAFAVANRIDWYTGSDQNVIDFWTNIVKPKFEAANAGTTLNLIDGGDGAGVQAIADRALADRGLPGSVAGVHEVQGHARIGGLELRLHDVGPEVEDVLVRRGVPVDPAGFGESQPRQQGEAGGCAGSGNHE